MALDEVVTTIRSASKRLRLPVVARLRHNVTALASQLAAVARGTRNAHILAAIASAGRARTHLDNALNHLVLARQGLESYLATITGAAPSGSRLPGAGPGPTPGRTVAPAPVGPEWVRPASVPDRVRKAAEKFLPRPDGVNRPTVGTFRETTLESGGRDKSIAADLDHHPLPRPPVTFYQHVESKAAAQMRQEGITSADLVVDNTVCGTNERDREHEWSCAAILPSILPIGSRLTVWVTRDSGETWWRTTYTGTGERIRP